MIGCMNKKLSATYMFNFLTKVTKALAERQDDVSKVVQLTWIRDSIAPVHSDLLCVARDRAPEMWLYAPFQSRPLGKALPSLLSVCPCSAEPMGQEQAGGVERRRKLWKVTHDGRPGVQLRDVKVRAVCRACRREWLLPQGELAGRLIRVNDVYAAVVPFFS